MGLVRGSEFLRHGTSSCRSHECQLESEHRRPASFWFSCRMLRSCLERVKHLLQATKAWTYRQSWYRNHRARNSSLVRWGSSTDCSQCEALHLLMFWGWHPLSGHARTRNSILAYQMLSSALQSPTWSCWYCQRHHPGQTSYCLKSCRLSSPLDWSCYAF